MAALTGSRDTPRYGNTNLPELLKVPMKAAAKGYQGGVACVDATGYCVPGATALNLKTLGIFRADVDNTAGANGGKTAEVRRGAFLFDNSAAGDLIAQADMYADVYLVDDHTVAKTNGGGTRSVAGRVIGFEGSQVIVELGR
jgi:hypothetical protein